MFRSFLRIGVACAVFDEDGRILLSHRGDMDVWNLPTGRLDVEEPLPQAAARECWEETGVQVKIEDAVGLYFLEATQRLNLLFVGCPVAGRPANVTEESRENRYFWLSSMPDQTFGDWMAWDAASAERVSLRVIATPLTEIYQLRLKLAWRWIKNIIQNKLEPRHVRFYVTATAIILDEKRTRFVAKPTDLGEMLIRVVCSGREAPWESLSGRVSGYTGQSVLLNWVGVWQQPANNAIDLIFIAILPNRGIEYPLRDDARWVSVRNAALIGHEAEYMKRVQTWRDGDKVWYMLDKEEFPTRLMM